MQAQLDAHFGPIASAQRRLHSRDSELAETADSAILVAVSQKVTTVTSAQLELFPWLEPLGFDPSDFKIEPRSVAEALSNIKSNGAWKEFWVTPPGSERCRLHLGPDKSPKQIKLEDNIMHVQVFHGDEPPKIFTGIPQLIKND
ncbi:unnamed protein product, partial [Prorocentrum cordatum]